MPSPELLETCNTLHRSTRNLLIQIFPSQLEDACKAWQATVDEQMQRFHEEHDDAACWHLAIDAAKVGLLYEIAQQLAEIRAEMKK